MINKDEKLILIAETLVVNPEDIDELTILADMDDYDSMTKLTLIVMFVDKFGKKLTLNEINSFKSIGDIMSAME